MQISITQTNSMKEETERKDYLCPQINIWAIEMEEGISAASATVLPVNASNQVQEDWTDGTNETNNVPW
ncbi:hypothetical protein CMT45_14025 [Elizabethkingia anophelis]|nr:hypothetical protein BBD28_09370 [Elizabethkingia anophelis]KUY16777.1 hypothetical protein ATB94_05010 [Elizabethkingia anophelis]MDV4072827.1 hypothetical protein [Elizabethkingia anophelis]